MRRGWIWASWLLLIVASFALLEGYALSTDNIPTLSRFVWTVSYYFPPFQYAAGFLTGFLVCHFWWGGIVPFAPVNPTKEKQ